MSALDGYVGPEWLDELVTLAESTDVRERRVGLDTLDDALARFRG